MDFRNPLSGYFHILEILQYPFINFITKSTAVMHSPSQIDDTPLYWQYCYTITQLFLKTVVTRTPDITGFNLQHSFALRNDGI